MSKNPVVEHPGWDDVHNLIDSTFMSDENLGHIPGDTVVPEEPRNLVEHPNGGVTKRDIEMVMCTVIHTMVLCTVMHNTES